MITFKDSTYCASPYCKNKCGRKMTGQEKEELSREPSYQLVAWGYFCGEDSHIVKAEEKGNHANEPTNL